VSGFIVRAGDEIPIDLQLTDRQVAVWQNAINPGTPLTFADLRAAAQRIRDRPFPADLPTEIVSPAEWERRNTPPTPNRATRRAHTRRRKGYTR
jgi:hypothetical protein